ncbi:MAG: competence/damage-inducible protein A [Planctomycetes bacterium]|nr:competence/damage-inducible protein A [Planctomycetota bacterium]
MFDKSVIILVVSREILEGAVVDRNAAFMASRLADIGYRVRTIEVIDRVRGEMVAAMKWAVDQQPTFVIQTGGMGPHWDDDARNALAEAVNLPLSENDEAVGFVENSYRRLHARDLLDDPTLNDSRRGMAMVPQGSVCFENTVGTAPAVMLRLQDTTVFLLPGVPAEMQRFFTVNVMPVVAAEGPDTVRGERHVDYYGHNEAPINSAINDIARKHPEVSLRMRVQGGDLNTRRRIMLVSEHEDPVALNDLLDQAEQDLRERLGLELQTRPTDASTIGD